MTVQAGAGNTGPGIIAIGSSTGGPRALSELLSALPHDLTAPILVVQHIPAFFSGSLAEQLNRVSPIEIMEARDGMEVRPGRCYIAPGGIHMLLAPSGRGGHILRLRDTPPVNSCKPAVDTLFESIARHGEGQVIAVILTGMGKDGCEGVRMLRNSRRLSRVHVLTQNEESCTVYGMPRAVDEAGLADESVHIKKMAMRIVICLKEMNAEVRK